MQLGLSLEAGGDGRHKMIWVVEWTEGSDRERDGLGCVSHWKPEMVGHGPKLRIFATEVKAFTDCARTAALQRLAA